MGARPGPAKKTDIDFLFFWKSYLLNQRNLGLGNGKHWPWNNSVLAGTTILKLGVDLPKISKKTKKYHFCWHFGIKSEWQLQISSFPTKVKFAVSRHKETINIRCIAPIRHSSRYMTKNVSYTLSKCWRREQVALLRCPAQFCEFRSEKNISYVLEQHVMCTRMGSLPFLFLIFLTSFGRFCIFSDRCIGHVEITTFD